MHERRVPRQVRERGDDLRAGRDGEVGVDRVEVHLAPDPAHAVGEQLLDRRPLLGGERPVAHPLPDDGRVHVGGVGALAEHERAVAGGHLVGRHADAADARRGADRPLGVEQPVQREQDLGAQAIQDRLDRRLHAGGRHAEVAHDVAPSGARSGSERGRTTRR